MGGVSGAQGIVCLAFNEALNSSPSPTRACFFDSMGTFFVFCLQHMDSELIKLSVLVFFT
jgi:hypothetical protein